jgi:ferric-dicitrate binding protein FerR (iron transport regulator)
MSRFETGDGRLDGTKLDMALQDLEAGVIDPLERDELMELIARSPAAQRAYLGYFETSAMLEAEAATYVEQGKMPKFTGFTPPLRLFHRSLLAAAALVLLAAVVAALIQVTRPERPEMALTAAADTRWSVTGEMRGTDGQRSTLGEGSTVRVDSGTLELRLESGATMILQGPAHVSFPKLTRPALRSGWLWIDTGASGEKFELGTPDLRIRNLGTRFGVRVHAEGPAEVHLIRGKLEVIPESIPGKPLNLAPEERGLIIPAQGEPTPVELARDPFPGIAGLLAASANYPTTVQGQNPAAYWRLEGSPGGTLRNEVEGETAGRVLAGVSLGASGPQPVDGFRGFDTSNQAARLPGNRDDSQISLGAAPPRHHGLLFREEFNGTGPLHQRRPGVGGNETSWVAAPRFQADGGIAPGTASATLAFQPVDGVIYTLDGSFRGVTSPDGDPSWIALGFASGQSTGTDRFHQFVQGEVTGRAWMLFRGTGGKFNNKIQDVGFSEHRSWENWNKGVGGDIEMRIVLDTTGGAGKWAATWFARRPGMVDFIEVGKTSTLPSEAIRSVGIAVSGDQIRSTVSEFSLRAMAVMDDPASHIRADGPARLSLRAGAVSCWLRREPGSGLAEILWSAGEDWAGDSIHARFEGDGRIGFFIENGRYDVLLTSEETLIDGRWHHLAASWSPHTVDLYLDGRRVAWERTSRDSLLRSLPELRVGSGPQGKGAAAFTGDIDEFAIWDRALTSIEIEQQYRSARNGGSKSDD